MIQTRRLTRTEDTAAIVFYFQGTTTLASLLIVVAAAYWPEAWLGAAIMHSQAWIWPAGRDWLPLIAVGLLGGIGQILMTQSYRFADASALADYAVRAREAVAAQPLDALLKGEVAWPKP